MRVIPVKSINEQTKNAESFISFAEEEYRLGITDVALGIKAEPDKPMVLITGPSGSGKTVTAHRLKAELELRGNPAHIISMDNYFLPIKGDISKVDLEAPTRVDIELFQEQAGKILRGEQVTLPVFDFKRQERDLGARFTRGQGEIVIFEGIHVLNPLVSGNLSESACTVYVSVRTRLKALNRNLTLHPSKIRLTRRFVRDKLFRGRSLAQTLEHFGNVERGEKLYIMPFKKYARFDIDTYVAYEPCVYKKHVLPELKALAENGNGDRDSSQVLELAMFLEELEDIADCHVPNDSLVREFIGGNTLME